MVEKFPDGDELMNKSHCVAKKSSSSLNRKNCNTILGNHLYLPSNQLEQDNDGTRISAVHKLVQSVLRVKRGIAEHCQ